MTKTMELVKKAQERSTIVSGSVTGEDISPEEQKKVDVFRANNKFSKYFTRISKKYKKTLTSGQKTDASRSVIERIEKNHLMVSKALKRMRNISR